MSAELISARNRRAGGRAGGRHRVLRPGRRGRRDRRAGHLASVRTATAVGHRAPAGPRVDEAAYCEAFGLERGQSLEGPETRKLRAAALASRLVFEPAMREGSAAGRDRARAGDLARDAARAARGRRMPEQRRRKAVAPALASDWQAAGTQTSSIMSGSAQSCSSVPGTRSQRE